MPPDVLILCRNVLAKCRAHDTSWIWFATLRSHEPTTTCPLVSLVTGGALARLPGRVS